VNPTGSDLGATFGGVGGHRWRVINRLIEIFWSNTGLQRAADESARIISEEIGDGATVVLLDEVAAGEAVYAISTSPERQQMAEQLFSRLSIDDLHRLIRAFDERPARTVNSIAAVLPEGPTYDVLISYSEYTELRDVALCPIPGRHGLPRGVIICSRNPKSERFASEDLAALVSAADSIGMGLAMGLAMAEAQQATSRWRQAFDLSPFGYAVIDLDQRITSLNRAGAEILGRSQHEAVGSRWSEFTDPTHESDTAAQIASLEAEQVQSVISEGPILRPDGTRPWIYQSLTLVRTEQSQPHELHLLFIDISDEREAEEQAAIFGELIKSSPDFISIADRDGAVHFVNDAGRALIRMPDEIRVEDSGIRATQFVDMSAAYVAQARATYEATGRWSGDGLLADYTDGSQIPVSVSSFRIPNPHTGEPLAHATIQRDIRERIRSEQAIAHLAEQRRVLLTDLLAAEQAERGRIASDVHDDALQLLAAGQLRMQLLLGQLERGDVPAALAAGNHIADILSEAQGQLRRLLLDLESPTEPGRHLEDALRETAESFFADTPTVVTVTGALSEVPSDAAAVFYRAGREAVSNARQHARAAHVTVRLTEDLDSWCMTVTDDGIGVPEPIPYRPGHLGVRGMSNRVAALGGSFTIGRAGAGGTKVSLRVPRTAVDQP
jgi:PAS domain S-box-containing protein